MLLQLEMNTDLLVCSLHTGKERLGPRDVLSGLVSALAILYGQPNIVRTTDSRGAAAQYMLSRRRLLHNIASSHITLHCPVDITFLVDLVQSLCDFNTRLSPKIFKTI